MKIDSSVSAVVTGGASGLGEATARALAAKGVKVAVFDLQQEKGESVGGEGLVGDVVEDAEVGKGERGVELAGQGADVSGNLAGLERGTNDEGHDTDRHLRIGVPESRPGGSLFGLVLDVADDANDTHPVLVVLRHIAERDSFADS